MKLYTKTGDNGESGLASGHRLPKSDQLFEVLGTIDELNSWLGLSLTKVEEEKLRHALMRIQDQLLIVGAIVAGSKNVEFKKNEVLWLEKQIDFYQSQFGEEWYKKFLLPGGTELAACLDVSRTVCRRAERVFISYSEKISQHQSIQKYLNRLSDYLFALRCFINHTVKYQETQFKPKYLKMIEKKH